MNVVVKTQAPAATPSRVVQQVPGIQGKRGERGPQGEPGPPGPPGKDADSLEDSDPGDLTLFFENALI